MDIKKIVAKAGYKGDQADYLVRKISEQQVRTKEDLLNLPAYFRSETIAGVSTYDLSHALHDAAVDLNATEAAVELAEKEGINVSAIKPTGKGGKVTVGDVKDAVEDK